MTLGPIETKVELFYFKNDQSEEANISDDLLSFVYDDKENGEADEISLLLKDTDGIWSSLWSAGGGESVKAYLSKGTTTDKGLNRARRYCGRFYIDMMRVAGCPRTFEMRAVSVPLNKTIRKKVKTRGWEGETLRSIAEQIAKEAAIEFVFDSEENPRYDRQDQSAESDLKFLSRLCDEAGLSLKVADHQIAIFDQAYFERQKPVQTITLGESEILSWAFDNVQSETYRSCTVIYRDPKKKKRNSAGSHTPYKDKAEEGTNSSGSSSSTPYADAAEDKKRVNPAVTSFTFVDATVDENGQEYVMKKRAKSIAEAERLAKAKLRQLNMRRVRGNITVLGDVMLVAGTVIECKGFGAFDGNFFIEEATHLVASSGYTTALRLRRVNNNY